METRGMSKWKFERDLEPPIPLPFPLGLETVGTGLKGPLQRNHETEFWPRVQLDRKQPPRNIHRTYNRLNSVRSAIYGRGKLYAPLVQVRPAQQPRESLGLFSPRRYQCIKMSRALCLTASAAIVPLTSAKADLPTLSNTATRFILEPLIKPLVSEYISGEELALTCAAWTTLTACLYWSGERLRYHDCFLLLGIGISLLASILWTFLAATGTASPATRLAWLFGLCFPVIDAALCASLIFHLSRLIPLRGTDQFRAGNEEAQKVEI